MLQWNARFARLLVAVSLFVAAFGGWFGGFDRLHINW